MATLAAAGRPERRRRPGLADTDWLVLRRMSAAIGAAVAEICRPGDRVIDFGCGDQPYRADFEARGAHYRGADFGDAGDLTIRPDGTIDAPDGCADIVASFQVLEHVRDLGRYFAEAHRILAPGGRLLLSTHGTWLFHPHPEDHRRWTRMGLVGELEAHGWQVEGVEALVGPLAFTTLIRLTGFCFALRRIPVIGPLVAAPLAVAMNLRAVLEDRVTPRAITADNACVYLVRARKALPAG